MTAVGKAPVLACLGVFLWKLLQAQALVRYQLCSQEGPQRFLVLRVRNQDKIKSSLTCIKPFQSRGSVTDLTLVFLRVEASRALNLDARCVSALSSCKDDGRRFGELALP